MQWLLNIQILLIINAINIIFTFTHNCVLHNKDYRCKLGTKTPYRFISNYNDSPLEYSGCISKKIWLLLRHGTRYPGKKYASSMIEKLPKLKKIILDNYKENKTKFTKEEAVLFKEWKISFSEDNIMKLTEEGENEMIDIGERYQSRFSNLMPEIYNNQTYKFKYTATQRTEESAKNFVIGLFGRYNSHQVQYPKAEHKDPILRFYKRCERWRSEIDKNPNSRVEKDKFLKSEIYKKMLDDVSKRIGYQINHENIYLMYLMCGFETAWNKKFESPWCKVFSLHDFKILEFADDLEYYWNDGYGYKLSYEQACPALRDVFNFFASDEELLVSAYFTHSGTILKLLTLLGVAKDDQHLTHDLFPLYADDRAWRTGIIDTFASNIAFILYNCSGISSVLFMHQERPLYLPGCPINIPCSLSTMKALYPDQEEECQFEKMCSMKESS
ncbi:Multiple inositol polyphosphate phosphatase [Apis cerana cerana]|uniref:Multiple inositol polyphosphate phosphatase 1 n=1 Tax=Apis cerana cerana TaxID=94128 RepID=A0A2A3E3A8_APICC|nr:Multiple inositol polyphosphate phosphatase [Apis cerana cerana]